MNGGARCWRTSLRMWQGMSSDQAGLPVYAHIADIQERDKVVYAIVTDAAGKVVAHSDLSKKGSVLSGDSDRAALKAQELLIQEITFKVRISWKPPCRSC